jgi:hypothetical protein
MVISLVVDGATLGEGSHTISASYALRWGLVFMHLVAIPVRVGA